MCISCEDGICTHPEVLHDFTEDVICDGEYRACRYFKELKQTKHDEEANHD